MRPHEWIPVSSDCTEWECKLCGFETVKAGIPCRNLPLIYTMPETGEELKFYCDDIANVVFVIDVHDS